MKIFAIFAKLSLRAGDEVDSIDTRKAGGVGVDLAVGLESEQAIHAAYATNMQDAGSGRWYRPEINIEERKNRCAVGHSGGSEREIRFPY